MKLCRCLPAVVLLVCASRAAATDDFQPPPAQKVDPAVRKQIEQKKAKLGDALAALRRAPMAEPLRSIKDLVLADIEIYYQAAHWITLHEEFFQKESAAWTLEALDRGLERVKKVDEGKFDWLKSTGKTIVRGYRSLVDDSVQPFAVTLPPNYGAPGVKWRLDVVLHGRDKNLNEVKFLHQFGDKKAPDNLQFVRIDIYGRGNNAYRWAGEMDVFEAKATFETFEELIGRGNALDKRRQVLRGFSMGGAGAWHIGLHRPDHWCVIGPGAGFTATHNYVKKLPDDLGWPQEQLLRIYDAVAYAENAVNVPIVAYAGSKDPQLQAARNIEALLVPTKLPAQFRLLVAPDLEHQFPPEWQQKAEEAYAGFVAKGREDYPKRVRFVTHTLKYGSCDWVDIVCLEKHYEKTLVDAVKTEDGFKATTTNVSVLRLRVPRKELQDMTVAIDGQEVTARPWGSKGGNHYVYLEKTGGVWKATLPQRIAANQAKKPRKVGGLQGPIDDAFTMPFVCVRGTGRPWSDRVDDYAEASLKRFKLEWAKYMRGDLPVLDDTEVGNDEIASKHLILFGDPGSNTMIANALQGLPLTWTREKVAFGGKAFAAANHVPLLVYPNPLNPLKYVVLNSGHTFHAADFEGTNALLYPRIGDYALLRLEKTGLAIERTELNGLFDESWQLMAGK